MMKNFFEGKKVPYFKIRKSCKKCGNEFVVYSCSIESGDSGMVPPIALECDKCSKIRFFDSEADSIFKHIVGYYNQKNKLEPLTWWGMYPWSEDIYRQFEKTFEACECGGRFKVMRNTCLNCGFEPNYEGKPKDIDVQKVDFIIHLAKHKSFKSLSDINDPELKEIFKDFDFSKSKAK